MPVLMSCPRGHQWEDLFDDQLSLQDGKSHCPVCGIALERLPANLAAEAALLPSTRQIHASTSVAGEKTSPEICLEPCGYDPETAAAASKLPPTERRPGGETKEVPTVGVEEGKPVADAKGPSLPGYEILAELGRGGMGVVYLARQTALDRFVAIKMVLGGGHAGAAQRRRFRLEAQAVARLHHPNIVQIYDVGEHEGFAYIVLQYIDGVTLAQYLKQYQEQYQANPDSAVALLEKVARAVQHAH
ncbi:MAG TPA: serine/threonine-protein kinase, partial [Gemmataceae bacterium]|nr:serine/threonine-protein kinase [Gemmataceae bacterium]